MGCGSSVPKEEFPGTSPGLASFGVEAEIAITQKRAASATTTAQVADAETDNQAKVVVEGTSAEVKAAAMSSEAARSHSGSE